MNKTKWIILLSIFVIANIVNIQGNGLNSVGVVLILPLVLGFIAGLIIRKMNK